MKKFRVNEKFEIGQTLPFIVLMLFVIIGMVALVLDGGSVMANRRTAQVAADAGAMAGANRACSGYYDAATVAEAYAVNNGATLASVAINGSTVTVETTVENPSFFAKIFGRETLTAVADATAGCYPLQGAGTVMPVAWSCRPTVSGAGFDEGKDCQINSLDWDALLEPLVSGEVSSISIPGNDGLFEMDGDEIVNTVTGDPPAQIYILMDEDKTVDDVTCIEDNPTYPGALVCDHDGDGQSDFRFGGARGWLYLEGKLKPQDALADGMDGTLTPAIWLPSDNGNMTVAFVAAQDYVVGEVVLVPVYDTLCEGKYNAGNQTIGSCSTAGDNVNPGSGDQKYYRVVTFAPFYVTCVHAKPSDPICSGLELADELNNLNTNKARTIEGFFLENIDLGLDITLECDVNLGNCTVSIIE